MQSLFNTSEIFFLESFLHHTQFVLFFQLEAVPDYSKIYCMNNT